MTSRPGQVRVLIVDDEPTIADSLTTIFSIAGYETLTAYSAEQARPMLLDSPPDLAIIDVCLPEMNGIDLAILLKAQCPDCRLILFSGQTATGDLMQSALDQGHDFDLLAKPVHPNELLTWAATHIPGSREPN